ncbi:MAG: glycosyltransferase family 2 protein, partial [bacterium]
MDDDAEPKEDALKILSLYFKNGDVVGLTGSVVLLDGNIAIDCIGKINLKDIFPRLQTPLNLKEYQKQVIEIDT